MIFLWLAWILILLYMSSFNVSSFSRRSLANYLTNCLCMSSFAFTLRTGYFLAICIRSFSPSKKSMLASVWVWIRL